MSPPTKGRIKFKILFCTLSFSPMVMVQGDETETNHQVSLLLQQVNAQIKLIMFVHVNKEKVAHKTTQKVAEFYKII